MVSQTGFSVLFLALPLIWFWLRLYRNILKQNLEGEPEATFNLILMCRKPEWQLFNLTDS